MNFNEILHSIPDFTNWKEAQRWLKTCQKAATQLLTDGVPVSLDWHDIAEPGLSPFGLYASKQWRKFVLAIFLADLVSYKRPIDQVSFDRLLFVMHAFPQGFRTWWAQDSDGRWWPAGYTGWYPMSKSLYTLFKTHPEELESRMVPPAKETSSYLYLFNYSAAPVCKKSALTQALMKRYAEDITAKKPSGLACITVSEDGIRVAERFRMALSGYLTLDGDQEGVFVR